MSGCSLKLTKHRSGMEAVILENDWLRAVLFPEKGADLYSLEYVPLGVDVLWKSPWGVKRPGSIVHQGSSLDLWHDYYEGGWQTMFPNAGNDCTYKGAFHGFHGEANCIPWELHISEKSRNRVEVV